MKIWKITSRNNVPKLSDPELILAIKSGLLQDDDVLISDEIDEGVKIKDSIYAFYLREDYEEK